MATPGKPDHHPPPRYARRLWTAPASARPSKQHYKPCAGPTNSPPTQLRAVLDRTYLRAAPTREATAEVPDLPFSTYRRYLAKALDQLTDLLWTVEIGDVHLPARPKSQ